MGSRTLGGDDRRLRRSAAVSRPLSIAIIVLVLAMMATIASGFTFLGSQGQQLRIVGEERETIRAFAEALRDADWMALRLSLGEPKAELAALFRALDALEAGRGAVLALLEPKSGAPDGAAALDELLAAWRAAATLVAAGAPAEARSFLSETETGTLVARLRASSETVLAERAAWAALYERNIGAGTWIILLLQIGAGGLAILGLVYAFRSNALESAARGQAVANADAARQKVGRLFDMADVLQSAADLEDANAVLKATAGDLVPGFPGALYVFNNSRDRLVLSTFWQRANGPPDTISPGSCWAIKRGKPHVSLSSPGKLCCEHHAEDGAVLEIPMIARGEILGLLQLYASGDHAEARLGSIASMGSALADGMSLALSNIALREKLRNQALRDALTGLYNRRYMEDTLQRFVRLAEREKRSVAVIMIDLDHFKRLNDEHGHAKGDAVLRDTASALVGALRETDVTCRYGGEELIVILPDCDLAQAAAKAEMLRARIEALSDAHAAAISASFGVSAMPETANGMADLITAADAALYRAKQEGRNRVATAHQRIVREKPAATRTTLVSLEAAE